MAFIDWASHVLQGQLQKVTVMKIKVNLQKLPQFELFSVTREHEVGMNSNRLSARNGELST